MHIVQKSIPIALLLVLGCDLKIDADAASHDIDVDSAASTDVDGGSTGSSSHAEEGSAGHDAPTTAAYESGAPCSAGDTEGPVETSSPPGPTSATDGPVETSSPTSQGTTDSPDTEGSVGTSYSDSGETATEGLEEPESGVCGWGAGGDEGGSQCLLVIHQCGDLPKLEMKCDTVSCVCLADNVQIGSCAADAVCDDLGSVQDKGPSCCGFPAVSP